MSKFGAYTVLSLLVAILITWGSEWSIMFAILAWLVVFFEWMTWRPDADKKGKR